MEIRVKLPRQQRLMLARAAGQGAGQRRLVPERAAALQCPGGVSRRGPRGMRCREGPSGIGRVWFGKGGGREAGRARELSGECV